MELCLSHPEYGYYMKNNAIGAAGDFTTAPEISQMFGEVIAAWVFDKWQQLGSPEQFALLELGPGHGTMMADVLRVASKFPALYNALQVYLLEQSLRLKNIQLQKLAGHKCLHLNDLNELPSLPLIILANEFFDALPVRHIIKHQNQFFERMVGLQGEDLCYSPGVGTNYRFHLPFTGGARGGHLSFYRSSNICPPLIPPVNMGETSNELLRQQTWEVTLCFTQVPITAPEYLNLAPEFEGICEFSPASLQIVSRLAEHLSMHGGSALIIDYGYNHPSKQPGETLQAVKSHQYADVLKSPGECDLTAHVDFHALEHVFKALEPSQCSYTTQGQFLTDNGIFQRAEKLIQNNPSKSAAIKSELERLVSDQHMGRLFKVLEVIF